MHLRHAGCPYWSPIRATASGRGPPSVWLPASTQSRTRGGPGSSSSARHSYRSGQRTLSVSCQLGSFLKMRHGSLIEVCPIREVDAARLAVRVDAEREAVRLDLLDLDVCPIRVDLPHEIEAPLAVLDQLDDRGDLLVALRLADQRFAHPLRELFLVTHRRPPGAPP